jgi:hypothetical protein
MPLDHLEIFQLRLPLAEPFPQNAAHVDLFVALAKDADGSYRLGEGVGFRDPACDPVFEYERLAGHGNLTAFLDRNRIYPDVTLPIRVCLDPVLAAPKIGTVTLCPSLRWNKLSEIPGRAHELARLGNKTAKIALPPSLDEANAVLRETIAADESHGLRFRYDAQGAFDLGDARVLVRLLDHPTTELLEQPLAQDKWEALAKLYDACPVPLMVKIRDARQVFRAADCADYVKLTLAEVGTPTRLLELIRQAREIGFKVILGNSAPGLFGSWLEGQIQLRAGLTNPGEMTGFRQLGEHPLVGVFETTTTGLVARPDFSWQTLSKLLARHCLRAWEIPLICPDFIRLAG